MPRFSCLLHASNLRPPADQGGAQRQKDSGAYAWRASEAETLEEAAEAAKTAFVAELLSHDECWNEAADPPIVVVEESIQLSSAPDAPTGDTGIVFYIDD